MGLFWTYLLDAFEAAVEALIMIFPVYERIGFPELVSVYAPIALDVFLPLIGAYIHLGLVLLVLTIIGLAETVRLILAIYQQLKDLIPGA